MPELFSPLPLNTAPEITGLQQQVTTLQNATAVGEWVDCLYAQDVVLASSYYTGAKFAVKRLTETLVQLECLLYCASPSWYLPLGIIPEGYRPSRYQILAGHGGAAGAGCCIEITPDGYVFLDYTDADHIMIAGIYAL